jgi:hypothetical protein
MYERGVACHLCKGATYHMVGYTGSTRLHVAH